MAATSNVLYMILDPSGSIIRPTGATGMDSRGFFAQAEHAITACRGQNTDPNYPYTVHTVVYPTQ